MTRYFLADGWQGNVNQKKIIKKRGGPKLSSSESPSLKKYMKNHPLHWPDRKVVDLALLVLQILSVWKTKYDTYENGYKLTKSINNSNDLDNFKNNNSKCIFPLNSRTFAPSMILHNWRILPKHYTPKSQSKIDAHYKVI